MTLGCKVNQYDTGTIAEVLRERGHTHVILGDGSDICILNTCAVTGKSVIKSKKAISRMKQLEPSALIAVCGCYTQLNAEAVGDLGVDLVSGTGDRYGFALKVEELVNSKDKDKGTDLLSSVDKTEDLPLSLHIPLLDDTFEELQPGGSENRTRALLKIQDGCDNYCSYCIVPYARGSSRSLSIERITEHAKKLAEQGYKEIVITGIEISSYGKDFLQEDMEAPTLMTAIKAINSAAPNARLRLGSLDPAVMTSDFCAELSKIPNMCNHFHLSVQSGSDRILKKMRRKYTVLQAMRSIDVVRSHFVDCGITSDIIVGFPGETESDFEQTLNFIKSTNLSEVHIFPYSKRPGTKAAQMPDQVDKKVNDDRVERATFFAKLSAHEFMRSQVGKTVEVLFENEEDGYSVGHSGNYLKIKVEGSIERNTIRDVKITDVEMKYKKPTLYGEIV